MNNAPAIPIHPETRNETAQSPVKSFIQPTNTELYMYASTRQSRNKNVLLITDHNKNTALSGEEARTPGYTRARLDCVSKRRSHPHSRLP
jgi:hypothetical protein